MAISRRALIKAGIAAAGVPLASAAPRAQPPAAMTGGIQFDITGLTLFQRWKTTKKFKVVLPDAKQCKLKDAHAPLLMMSYDDYFEDSSPFSPIYAPTVVRYGSETMLTWSLQGWKVWMGGVQTGFDMDPSPAMTFDDSTPAGAEPTPIDSESGWSPLHWFANLGDTLHTPPPTLTIRKPALVTSEIVFTRGHAFGRSPVLCLARVRKYEIGGAAERTLGTNLSVWHPPPTGATDKAILNLTPIQGGKTLTIPIRLRTDRSARLMISHNPLTMTSDPTSPGHVTAYYLLVGKKGPKVDVKNHAERCVSAADAANAAPMAAHGPLAQGHPPDSDCVSMLMEME
jgi:hypothetical protein